jgi:hypothetical protein
LLTRAVSFVQRGLAAGLQFGNAEDQARWRNVQRLNTLLQSTGAIDETTVRWPPERERVDLEL